MRSPDVTLIIPQYNRSELTVECVRSFRAAHGDAAAVLVVDDGSRPEERDSLREALGGRETILERPHRGVTAAWNAGLAATSSPWLAFLNNDTLSHGPWLERLLAPLRTGAAKLAGVERRRERHLPDTLRTTRAAGDLLAGWCLALQRRDLLRLGGFDEALRRYFSDTDLQVRLLLTDAGEEPLICVDDLPLVHLGHATAHQLDDRGRQWNRDRLAFRRKWEEVS